MTPTERVGLAYEIAMEHVAWAIRDGQEPAAMLRALGTEPPSRLVTHQELFHAYATAWLRLSTPPTEEEAA
jgi:hypothetical protein